MENYRFIHLLYVPTMACNMACKYCYLEDNTQDEYKNINPLETLKYAINKFKSANVIPFNISLHGGEVTTLSHDDFYKLIKYINDYYNDNKELITEAGFKIFRQKYFNSGKKDKNDIRYIGIGNQKKIRR